jgi:hypothetical protein
MNIAFALKEKNRITGRIKKLQTQIENSNFYKSDQPPDLDSKVLLIKLQEEWAYLIDLKTKIAKANIGIADKLIRLAEAKAELTFWNHMTKYSQKAETTSMRSYYIDGSSVQVPETIISTITSMEVLTNIDKVQSIIETLQDEIDVYNGTTKIS